MKLKIASLIIGVALCGCSTTVKTKSNRRILEIIESQKVMPANGKLRPMTNDFDLYYLGWNDSAENIAHHIKQ
jgi:hypothetical protein